MRGQGNCRAGRGRQLAGGIAALIGALAMLVGVPYVLYSLGGNPLPNDLPDLAELRHLLTSRDDGTLFLFAITWVGWAGWASFAIPLLVEFPYQLARRRPPRILGLAWQQRRAAALVATILAVAAPPAVASASAAALPAAPASAAAAPSHAPPAPKKSVAIEYEVAKDDWLYHVAARFLGDGERYPEIARVNPQLEREDPRFPDHIERGQVVRLPAEARDRGPRTHATGTVIRPAVDAPTDRPPPRTTPSPAPAVPLPTSTAPASPSVTASAPTPAQPGETAISTAPAESADRATGDDDALVDRALPLTAAFATAGLVCALILFQLARRRRRQRQHRRPGRRIAQPAEPTTERRVRNAAQPADVQRLDTALRTLAATLREHDAATLPDVAATWLDGGDVHLMLVAPAAPPEPFEEGRGGMTWALRDTAQLPPDDDALAPLPALATVASAPGGEHLLIDLERAGLLTIGGDARRGGDLLRYIAAELSTSEWSDDVEVVLVGFPPDDADNLVALGDGRVRIAASLPDALGRVRRRAAASRASMAAAGVPDAFACRVRDEAADALMPHILLVADPTGNEDEIAALDADLAGGGRCAVAVCAVTTQPSTWRITISGDGAMAIDWLSVTSTTATSLTSAQLADLADMIRTARAALGPADEPVPPAWETEPWAAGTDAHGHVVQRSAAAAVDVEAVPPSPTVVPDLEAVRVRDAPAEQERSPAVAEPVSTEPVVVSPSVSVEPSRPRTVSTSPGASTDPDLDADLEDWHNPATDRPRVAVLGPVVVQAPGEPPEERIRFYSEIIVYLAQRGQVGATGDQVDEALWPERTASSRSRRVAMSKARRWLGETADGRQWLPPNGPDRRYRLEAGYLLDWHLFRRLRARGESRGLDGIADLRRALELVRGAPLAGAELPYSSGYRNPYAWLPGSEVQPHNLASAVADTAHQLVELYLAAGDTVQARWAVERAWLADPDRLDDQPWIDAMRLARIDGRAAELRALLDDLVRARDAEVPEDLSPATYAAIREMLGDLLRTG